MNAAAMTAPISLSMRLLERGSLPDFLIRLGIRRLLKARHYLFAKGATPASGLNEQHKSN